MNAKLLNSTVLGILVLSACASNQKSPLPTDELPKSPRVAPLDPQLVLPDQPLSLGISEYKQALTRSQGFIFNMRVMPLTDAYQKVINKTTLTEKTCLRLEFDTFDKKAALTENWAVEWISAKDEKIPLVMTIDPETIKDLEKARSLQIRASLCGPAKLNLLPNFKVSVLRKYEKKPEAEIFEWTEWKPGVSSSPLKKRW